MTRARDLADLLTGGQTITTDDNTVQLTLKSTDADATSGPVLSLLRDSGSPADSDVVGEIRLNADNDAGQETEMANIFAQIGDASDGTEDAALITRTMLGGAMRARTSHLVSETVFNEDSQDLDFRVESNGSANMLFVDGGNDAVGINTNSPHTTSKLHVFESSRNGGYAINTSYDTFIVEGETHVGLSICGGSNNSGSAAIAFPNGSSSIDGLINYEHAARSLQFYSGGSERARFSSSGTLGIGKTPNSSLGTVGTEIHQDGTVLMSRSSETPLFLSRSDDGAIVKFFRGTAQKGDISVNGSSTAYNTSSDYRLKENIDYSWDATSRLKQLKPARFNFIADPDKTVDGFLAHEAQTVVPESVTGTKDETRDVRNAILSASGALLFENITQDDWTAGKLATKDAEGNDVDALYPSDSTWKASHTEPVMQGIDQSKLVPLLVKTIQELEARITALESA